MPRKSRPPTRRRRAPRPRPAEGRLSQALLVIDHGRLQAEAWAELHTERKRFERATRDLQRHEEIDVPAYESWLHRTFPIFLSRLRELHAEVATKASQVEEVLAEAAYSGGSLKRLWRQQKARAAAPPAEEDETEPPLEDDEPSTHRRREAHAEDFERAAGPKPSRDAREIYRRLVQRLHPDRGGPWTTAREHLWHEVQRAWAAADTDWLARLEVDWEAVHEVLGPGSSLSGLRRAIEETHAARRDTERKLREYRVAPAWRFTRNEKNRAALQRRTESNFEHDLRFLKSQLNHLNATIAAWEEDWTRADARTRSRRRRFR